MAAVRHLGFVKVRNFTSKVRRANVHQHAKFCACRSNRCVDMANSRFFQMATVRHIVLLEVCNFNCQYGSKGQYDSSCQILHQPVKLLLRYGLLRVFKMAAVRHLGFVIRLFGPSTKCTSVASVTM